MKNVYLYYYNDYQKILHIIKEKKTLKDVYIDKDYDLYILSNKDRELKIILFKSKKIMSIICEKYRDIVSLNIIDSVTKINLLDKRLFNNIFELGVSNNLCKIVVDIDIIGDEFELVELNGLNLLNLDIIHDFEIQDINSNTNLKSYSFQPYGYKYLISIKSINKIEFNKRYSTEDIIIIVEKLTRLFGGDENNING